MHLPSAVGNLHWTGNLVSPCCAIFLVCTTGVVPRCFHLPEVDPFFLRLDSVVTCCRPSDFLVVSGLSTEKKGAPSSSPKLTGDVARYALGFFFCSHSTFILPSSCQANRAGTHASFSGPTLAIVLGQPRRSEGSFVQILFFGCDGTTGSSAFFAL